MTYEEWYKELKPIVFNCIKKYKSQLKMEKEDMQQEADIFIFEIMDKLNELEETGQKYLAYFKSSLNHKFEKIKEREHKQLIHLEISDIVINDDGEEFCLLDTLDIADNNINFEIVDDYIEYKRQYHRKWYSEHKERYAAYRDAHRKEIRAYARNYYHQHKDELNSKERARIYYDNNRERICEQHRKRYQENIEEERKRKKEYYYTHKDEINERRKLKRQQLKQLKEGVT